MFKRLKRRPRKKRLNRKKSQKLQSRKRPRSKKAKMDELHELRKRKFEAIRQHQSEQLQEKQQMQQQIAQLEAIVRQVLTKEALARYSNLRIAYPDKAVQVLVILAQAIQSGQLNSIDDNLLKQILKKLTPQKKEFKIKKS